MIDVQNVIKTAKSMVSFPAAAKKLVEILNEDVSAAQVIKILLLDPSITARIVVVANSPFYASRKKITDIRQAITRIGFRMVKQIAITQSFGSMFGRYDLMDRLLWEHAIAAAILNREISQNLEGISSETAYTIGLLHDFGKVILKKAIPESYNSIIETFYNGDKDMKELEFDAIGITHDYIIGEMAAIWNLGDVMTFALSHHHGPFDTEYGKANDYAVIANLSDVIANKNGIGRKDHKEIDIESTESFNIIGSTIADIKLIENKSIKQFSDTINLF